MNTGHTILYMYVCVVGDGLLMGTMVPAYHRELNALILLTYHFQ